jgi:hypothetical protein
MLFRVLRRDFWGFTLAFDGEVQGNDGTALWLITPAENQGNGAIAK